MQRLADPLALFVKEHDLTRRARGDAVFTRPMARSDRSARRDAGLLRFDEPEAVVCSSPAGRTPPAHHPNCALDFTPARDLTFASMRFSLLPLLTLALAVAVPARAVEYDVVVYGGTCAGVIAAVQTKRLGKSVVLVSPDRHLGGLRPPAAGTRSHT